MLKDLNWEPLANRRRNNRLCLLFKAVNGLVAIPAETHMKFSKRPSHLGRQKTITVIGSKKDPYKYSFFPRTIIDWNQLPKTSVTSKTIEEFKASLTSNLVIILRIELFQYTYRYRYTSLLTCLH